MDYAQWEGKQMGSYGEGAGAAYVFLRSTAAEGYVWEQDQVGKCSDTRTPSIIVTLPIVREGNAPHSAHINQLHRAFRH